MTVRNCGTKAWRWPFTEDGVADVVRPGETYDIDLSPKGRQPGESSLAYRARVDAEMEKVDPRVALMDSLYKAGMLVSVPRVVSMH